MGRRTAAGPCLSTAARAPRPRSRSLGSRTSWLPSSTRPSTGCPPRGAGRSRWRCCSPSRTTAALRTCARSVWHSSMSCASLAERGPVLLALDDVQWLDVSSAAVLSVALRRLGDEPVAVLGTMRTEAGAVVPEALAGMPLERLTLEPLDLAAVHRLLRDRLGLELPRPQLARIHRAAGGNRTSRWSLLATAASTFRTASTRCSGTDSTGCRPTSWRCSSTPPRSRPRPYSSSTGTPRSPWPSTRGSCASTATRSASPTRCSRRSCTTARCPGTAAPHTRGWLGW